MCRGVRLASLGGRGQGRTDGVHSCFTATDSANNRPRDCFGGRIVLMTDDALSLSHFDWEFSQWPADLPNSTPQVNTQGDQLLACPRVLPG